MADVVTFGSDEPRGPRRRWIAVVGAVVLTVVVSGIVVDSLGDDASTPRTAPSPTADAAPTTDAPPTADPGTTGAAVPPPGDSGSPCVLTTGISPRPAGAPAGVALDIETISAADSCDSDAVNGPWSVLVRGAGGRLGRGEAVVTFPVDPPAGGARVSQSDLIVWAVGGGWRASGAISAATHWPRSPTGPPFRAATRSSIRRRATPCWPPPPIGRPACGRSGTAPGTPVSRPPSATG